MPTLNNTLSAISISALGTLLSTSSFAADNVTGNLKTQVDQLWCYVGGKEVTMPGDKVNNMLFETNISPSARLVVPPIDGTRDRQITQFFVVSEDAGLVCVTYEK